MQILFAKPILIVSILALFLVTSVSVYSKSDNAAAKDNPGQSKKEDVVVGNVEKITGNSMQVEDKKDKKTTTFNVTSTTKIVGQDKKVMKLQQIKANDKVMLIGSQSAKEKLTKVTKILVKQASTSAQSKRQAVHGVITAISGSNITVAHQIQRDRIYQITTTASTIIKSPKEATSSATLALGQRIVAVGDNQGDGIIVAKMIHLIPGKATGITKKYPVSSVSATPVISGGPTSTPSATITLTPTLTPISSPSATPTL